MIASRADHDEALRLAGRIRDEVLPNLDPTRKTSAQEHEADRLLIELSEICLSFVMRERCRRSPDLVFERVRRFLEGRP